MDRNTFERLKRGIEKRVMLAGVTTLCYEAQKDWSDAFAANQRKIKLLFLLHGYLMKCVEVKL